MANAHTAARAEFIQATLAAHGITATLEAMSIYPSVDFVEGRGVAVRMENAARAREVLNALGLSDGAPTSEE